MLRVIFFIILISMVSLSLFYLGVPIPTFETEEPVPEKTPLEKYEEMEVAIEEITNLWVEQGTLDQKDARYAEMKLAVKNARLQMVKIYQEQFLELQPALYENDPIGCIQTELAFGRFIEQMKKQRKDKLVKNKSARRMQGDELLAKLKEEISDLPVPKIIVSDDNQQPATTIIQVE